ncbi:16148_t:CDS:2, partial [Cetraspora pellucida]
MDPTCNHCGRKVISYPKKLCRSNSLSRQPSLSCGNDYIDTFIQNTVERKQHCDDFIEWIPFSDINIDKTPIAKGLNSEVFIGKWEPLKQSEVVDHKESTNVDIVLKVLRESKNFRPEFLNEFVIHYKCLGKCAIPFYGLTEHMRGYAMVLKHAFHGDLRRYIDQPNLACINKIEILFNIAKSLNALHELNIVHRDFHCGNILIDNDMKVFISDFEFSSFADSPSNLAKKIALGGLRPDIVDGTPETYKMIMEKCWDSEPSERPNSSQLIEWIENMIKDIKQLPGIITLSSVPQIDLFEKALRFKKDKEPDDHEKAEALIVVEESASLEKCNEIVADQKNDGCIELSDTVCDELDAPKEEIITTIQPKLTNKKLQLLNLPSILATAINLSYLKKAAPKHEGVWKVKHDKARKYLSDQIGDEDAEKELLDCTDDYVVDNCIKKVIKDKKRNAVITVQESTTPEKCDDIVSNQNDNGSFEVSETICKDINVPVTNVVTEVKKCAQIPKLRSPKSEPWWKTALTISYLNITSPHHKKQWEDKHDKARKYLSDQIRDADAEKELLDCTDKYIIDNIAKKIEKDHKKKAAIAVVQDEASPDKHKEIVSKQKDDGSIEIDDLICKELHAPKKEIIDKIKENITNPKLKLPEFSSSLATAINLSYLTNAASKYKGEWIDKYNNARNYLSKKIGDVDAEKELLDCTDEYVVDKVTNKVIEEQKKKVIAMKKDEISKEENPKAKAKNFFGSLYEGAVKLDDQIEKALGFNKDKLDDHEKAEALIIVEESALPEKCKEIVADQKDDGCIELSDTVCDELDTLKEEIITTIQPKLTNKKLQLPNLPSILATAINLSYLKKAALKHEGVWKDKHDKARKYLSDQIGDEDAEKELLDCTDDYVVDNCIKKVIKDKKRNAVITLQESTTPEKCDDIVSNQKNDGSFEVNETICKEIDVPATDVVNEVTECTQNPKLRSPKSEPWWKTALAISFLNVAAPHYKNQWEDKSKKAHEYLTKEIKDSDTEKELLDCTDQYLVDNIAKKVEKDHKKAAAIAVIQESTSPDKHKEIVSKQNDDGSIQLYDSVCNDLGVTKENVITTIKNNITNPKLQLPQLQSVLETAVNLSYLKNAASKYKGDWVDKYNKARDYLSKQIGDSDAEKELLECADNYVVDKATDKAIEDYYKDIIAPKTKAPFVPEIYSDAPTISEEEALCTAQEAASPDKCKDIVSNQKEDGSIELDDTVCDELDVPKEEIIPTIQKNVTHEKLKSSEFPSLFSTAIVLSYLKKIAPKHKDHWKEQYDKACEYISKKVGDADAEKELEECADKYVVDKITEKANKDEPIVKHYKTTQTLILDKHIEDIISDDKEPDQKDKEAAFVITQERVTPEVCEAITSAADDDGHIELNETVCKELDLPKEEIINTIQKNVTNEKLKSP